MKGFATEEEKHEKNNHSNFSQMFYRIRELKVKKAKYLGRSAKKKGPFS